MNLQDLKKEMPFKWRVQSTNQYACTCVAYIDARDVQDLLDEVCEPAFWQVKYSEHKGNLFCSIGIDTNSTDDANPIWVWKSDCGTESQVEKQKGEASDAFKRAAVMWGIGRFLYSLGVIKIKDVKKEDNGKYTPCENGQKIWDINEYCNDIHSGKKQLPKKSYKQAAPVVKKVETKKEDRKPALTIEQYNTLLLPENNKHVGYYLKNNRMSAPQRKELESILVKEQKKITDAIIK